MKARLERGLKNFHDLVEDSNEMNILSKHIARKIATPNTKDAMAKKNAKSTISNLIDITKNFVDGEIHIGIEAAIDTIQNSDATQTLLNSADLILHGKGDSGNITNQAFILGTINTTRSAVTNAISAMRDGAKDAIQNGIKGIVQGIILNVISANQETDKECAAGNVQNTWEYIKMFIKKLGSSDPNSEEQRVENDASEIVDFIISAIFSDNYEKKICPNIEAVKKKIVSDIKLEYGISDENPKIENQDLCKKRKASVSEDITVTSEKVYSETSKVDDEGDGNASIPKNNTVLQAYHVNEIHIDTTNNSDHNTPLVGKQSDYDCCSHCNVS